MAITRKKIAVMFGGRSPEHDVSIVTALQVIDALDPELYECIPVYIAGSGRWYTGDELTRRNTYIPDEAQLSRLLPVVLGVEPGRRPFLQVTPRGLLARSVRMEFDVAVPAFHGTIGEDGNIQGLLEVAGVPYTGMRTLASAVFMDKAATKHVLAGTGIPLLPFEEIRRPNKGYFLAPSELEAALPLSQFPCCVKPSHLGSSIGVARVVSFGELAEVLPTIFKLDESAILEPFVDNLVEYNVSVCRFSDGVRTSAIERPKHTSELLDFKTKYLSGAKTKSGSKMPGATSEGMLSLTREIGPTLSPDLERNIRRWATQAFERVGGSGAPRFDFLCNAKTGEIWLNEANPCPGSFAYFLWDAAERRVRFPQLLDHMIQEALALARGRATSNDPTPHGAQLFPRRGT